MIGIVREEEIARKFCIIVSSQSLCPTTGKQRLDYVRAKSNYIVKLL